MLKRQFIKRKITLIQEELGHLEKLGKFSFQKIAQDHFLQSALERILEKIIMRAVDINQHILVESESKKISAPKDYTESFLFLGNIDVYPKKFAENISKSAGTRNALVHDYDEAIDYERIYNSIDDCLKDYVQYCEYILAFLRDNEAEEYLKEGHK